MAFAAGRRVVLYRENLDTVQEYPEQPSTVADLQWQPGGRFFAVAAYGKLSILEAGTAEPNREFSWQGSILKLAWSPDSNFIATGNQDATVHFWYRKTGRDLEMSGYSTKVRELSWDEASRLLASGGGPIVHVWNCSGKGPDGTKPIELKGHLRNVSTVSFQNQGNLLASGGRDGRLCVWNPSRGDSLLAGVEFRAAVSQAAWSKDDRLLAVSGEGGLLAVFSSPSIC